MVFSSLIFLFYFLPVVLILHWLVPASWRNGFLLLVSLCFYAWGEGVYVALMLTSILMNWYFAIRLERAKEQTRKIWISFAVFSNLGMLAVFKYSNFVVDNLNQISDDPILTIDQVHLPIGISFFTFQAMSYVIEVYRRVSPVQSNPLNVGLYIALFPQLIAGPIVRYGDIADQITNRIVKLKDFSNGVDRFILGLGKKVLIANPLGFVADQIFLMPPSDLATSAAWLGIMCYSLQIYFDFSGYSDMAIGLGRMFGFTFLENFNYPYISQSIQEFWRRWHISLSNWFRDFLYIPLGGSRHSTSRTYANLFIVFLLCGLWHGASWNFVIWGILHGLFLVVERMGLNIWLQKIWRPLRHFYVIFVVMIAWVFFRVETLDGAISYLIQMFTLNTDSLFSYDYYFNSQRLTIFIFGVLLAMPIYPWVSDKFSSLVMRSTHVRGPAVNISAGITKLICLTVILIYSLVQLISGSHNPFIYFRF